MSSRSDAAYRSNRTRAARTQFAEAYPYTWDIAREVIKGRESEDIADDLDVSTGTVAAVKANLARWCTFSDMAYECNF